MVRLLSKGALKHDCSTLDFGVIYLLTFCNLPAMRRRCRICL